MLPIWSECQATVLIVMVVEMVVYTEHISNHLENHVSEEFSEPHFMPEKRTVSDFWPVCVCVCLCLTASSKLNKSRIIYSGIQAVNTYIHNMPHSGKRN